MKTAEIEQMRAKVAAAWGVGVSEVEHEKLNWAEIQNAFTILRYGLAIQWRAEGQFLVSRNHSLGSNGKNSSNFYYSFRSGFNAPYGCFTRNVSTEGEARFFFCMGYDIAFLEAEGVAVSAHDKLEWACQMRDAGFPIEMKS